MSSSSSSSCISPDVASASGEQYPIQWLGSKNPITEPAQNITPHISSQQNFLQYYGFQSTPIAIYTMYFEDGPRVKGQPKMFHANFTHPHDGSNIVIDGKVYTHKAFSNQQAAYRKDRYGMMIVSPTLCYTMHGVVDNEKKRQERIARELRLDGEEKCSRKKRRQVFKINDSAVMMRRDGFESDYPTYAFNTNATYTIAFYARTGCDHVIHTGVRYTQCEHDVFVHITASHGGEIVVSQEPIKPVMISSRKRKPILAKKRKHSNISQDDTLTLSPISSSHHTPISPPSPPSSPDSYIESSSDILSEFPITHVSESSFISEKRARTDDMNPYYEPYPSATSSHVQPSYGQQGMYGSHPMITGPSLPISSPLLEFSISDPIDPLSLNDDDLPDTIPTLSSIFSLPPLEFTLNVEQEQETEISWL